jgi:hypothetical protein
VFEALAREADLEWLMIDSMIVQAHSQAAGGPGQDPTNRRDTAGAVVDAAFKLTLKLIVKTIAHGLALRHQQSLDDRWERTPAYGLPNGRSTFDS